MKKILGLLLILPFLAHAQGVKFEQGLSWEQVKTKAKAEHKYIFADCFATWCGPCKMMDKNIYPNDTVGNAVNSKFISIKVQMDTSKEDNADVKAWYADAHNFMHDYKIGAFPTFLFFSPDGKLVHRDLGYKKKKEFLALADDAVDPKKQYYTMKENYEHGKKDYTTMPALVEAAKSFKDKELATAAAQDYINNYLIKLKESELYTKKNIEFIAYNIKSSKGKAFDIFYHHADQANKITGQKDLSERVVNYIIYVEEIAPAVDAVKGTSNNPDWNKITKTIEKKYGTNYAERNVIGSQVRYYTIKKDWDNAVKYNVLKTEKFGLDSSGWGLGFNVNNMVYEILFKHSNDKEVLKKALEWEQVVLDRNPKDYASLDTKANILYKLGRTKEALELEAIAAAGIPNDKEVTENYEKMKKGEPTWPKD